MDEVNIPEGYQQVMPYLIVKDASAFLSFCKDVFGVEVLQKIMRDGQTIMHAEVRFGDSVVMLADSTEQFKPCTAGLFIYVADADQVYQQALQTGAESLMPPADQSYGRACGVKDPFGNTWWITTPVGQ